MIAKELRALLPVWVASAAALVACALVRTLYPFGIPSYFIGAATLGAMTFGHEYSHRTVPLMLTLPVSRARILLTKLVVLGASLLLLAIVAATVLPFWREALYFRATVLWLPFFAALLITPWLTVVTRSPLGGAVFTLGLSGILLVAGEWIGIRKYGYTSNVDAFRVAFVWYALVVLSAVSAIAVWWTMRRMQSIDGAGEAVDLTPSATTTLRTLTRHNPTWLLIQKELRLQQLAFAVAALFVVLFPILSRRDGALVSGVVPVLFAGVVAVLIGATASAEERHLRTLDAQLLLPVSSSRQWWIKVGVVLTLTTVLAIVLPAALTATFASARITASIAQMFHLARIALTLLGLTVVSLYVSTLCSSGIWALMVAVPAIIAASSFAFMAGDVMERTLHGFGVWPDGRLVERTILLLSFAVFAVALRLGLVNHRAVDRSARRIAGQVAAAAATIVLAFAIAGITAALLR